MPWRTCGSQRSTGGSLVFPSTLWVLGIELGLPRLGSKHSHPLSHFAGSQQVLDKMHFLELWDCGLHFLDDCRREALSCLAPDLKVGKMAEVGLSGTTLGSGCHSLTLCLLEVNPSTRFSFVTDSQHPGWLPALNGSCFKAWRFLQVPRCGGQSLSASPGRGQPMEGRGRLEAVS